MKKALILRFLRCTGVLICIVLCHEPWSGEGGEKQYEISEANQPYVSSEVSVVNVGKWGNGPNLHHLALFPDCLQIQED